MLLAPDLGDGALVPSPFCVWYVAPHWRTLPSASRAPQAPATVRGMDVTEVRMERSRCYGGQNCPMALCSASLATATPAAEAPSSASSAARAVAAATSLSPLITGRRSSSWWLQAFFARLGGNS